MKQIPLVVIIGRRNVGKSTLFNSLIKKKHAIVDDLPGLTRDILNFKVNHPKCSFILSDTPGLDLPKDSELSSKIISNAENHLENADLIVFLLENPSVEKFDHTLISKIRKLSKPMIVAVNKMDSSDELRNMSNFYELGVNDILPISAKSNFNIPMLLDKIADLLPHSPKSIGEPDLKISLVGKPNAGKSTLLNAFMGCERSIVSDIPGTTRDSVNDSFRFEEKTIEIIDTAGIRRKKRIKEDVEYYSLNRSIQSIKDSDVVVHLIDAAQGLTEADKKIADQILEVNKPLIIAVNKWDAVTKTDKTFEEFKEYLLFKFYRTADFPIIAISAKEKTRIHKLLKTAMEMKEKASKRIGTAKLNKALEEIQREHKLPSLGSDIKIYYATQVDTIPPQFKLFVNNEKNFRADAVRFLQKEFQKLLGIHGIPIVIKLEGKDRKRKEAAAAENKSKVKPKPKTKTEKNKIAQANKFPKKRDSKKTKENAGRRGRNRNGRG